MPPDPNEVEVSVFGPGHGECVVVHLGDGEWMVVDSCRHFEDGRAAALRYLEAEGVAVETAVKLVIVTHWHDDHIRGLGEIAERCSSARFVCSGALKATELPRLAFAHSNN